MARTVVKRLSATLAVLIASSFMVTIGSPPAHAIPSIYSPDPVRHLPSTQGLPDANNVLTSDEALIRKYEIQMGQRGIAGGGFMTKLGAVGRFAGGAPGAIISMGLAVGGTTVRPFFNSVGADYDEGACALGSVYTGAVSLLTMGTASPDCSVAIPQPNADQPHGGLSYNGTVLGKAYFADWRSADWGYCIPIAGATSNAGSYRSGGDRIYAKVAGTLLGLGSTNSILKCASFSNPGYRERDGVPGDGWAYVTLGCRGNAGCLTEAQARGMAYGGLQIGENGAVKASSTTANPQRNLRCKVTTAQGTPMYSTRMSYTEAQGFPVGKLKVACESALSAFTASGGKVGDITGFGIEGETVGTAGAQDLATLPIPPEVQQANGLYADCVTGGCQLVLEQIVGTQVSSCFDTPGQCAQWYPDTANGTQTTTAKGETYRCRYGEHQVALSECAIYQNAFPNPATTTQRGTLTDPKTGRPLEESTNVRDRNSYEESNTTNPGSGPTPGEQCMAQWSAAPNPIEWVAHPVKCAMVWAGVPRTTVVNATIAQLTTSWNNTGVGKLSTAISGWSFVAPGNGCSGVNLGVSRVWPNARDFTILNACAGQPLAPIATLSSWVLGIVAVLGAVHSVTRSVAGIVGYSGLASGDAS